MYGDPGHTDATTGLPSPIRFHFSKSLSITNGDIMWDDGEAQRWNLADVANDGL